MKKKSTLILVRVLAVVLVLAIAGAMLIIGRGHTVYFDNKTFEKDGKEYPALYKVTCYRDGEKFSKLQKRDRGMVDVMGQKLQVTLEIEAEKGDAPVTREMTLELPYSSDGLVVNIPAFLADLPVEVYMSEFVPVVVEETEATEAVDEFGLSGMEG